MRPVNMSVILLSLSLICGVSQVDLPAAYLDFTTMAISSGAGNAIHPSVGVSADGHVMAVWWNQSSNRIMARLYTPGSGLSGVIELPGQSMPSTWPRVRGGAGSEFHVVWSAGYSEHNHSIQYAHYNGKSFSSPLTLHNGGSMWPDLCYNANGNIVTVAWELYIGGLNGEIMVRQKRGGSWTGAVNASKTSYYSGRARIATDNSGNLHLVWMEKTGGTSEEYEAFYNRTSGGNWQSPVNISADGSMRVLPNVAVRANGSEVYVQWLKMSDHFHWGRVITFENGRPVYGTSHRIGHGSYDNLHYYTGMVYHDNVLYITYVDEGNRVWIRNYQGNNTWGSGGTLTKVNCPRTPDIAQSASLGLGVVWYNLCDSPNTVYVGYGSGFGEDPGDPGDPPTPPPPPEPNKPPVARILLSPSSGIYPLKVTFNGTSSSDSDGKIVSYAWNLGDGATSTTGQFTHSYQYPGSYPVYLTVKDDDGDSSTASALVTVYGMEPPLNIVANYHQNRNLFSVEHYYRVTWANNPINQARGFNIAYYNVYRRLKGEKNYSHLTRLPRRDSNEFLDRSLSNEFRDYEYTVTCQDLEGRTSDLPSTARADRPPLTLPGVILPQKK